MAAPDWGTPQCPFANYTDDEVINVVRHWRLCRRSGPLSGDDLAYADRAEKAAAQRGLVIVESCEHGVPHDDVDGCYDCFIDAYPTQRDYDLRNDPRI
jgi:hypothetical protein